MRRLMDSRFLMSTVMFALVLLALNVGVAAASTITLDEVPERLPRIGEQGEIRTVAVF